MQDHLLLDDFHKNNKKNESKSGRPKISFQLQFGTTESVSSAFNYILSHLARKEVWVNMKLVTL